MEVVSFKLYQRKLIADGLSAMFYKGRGRERVGLAASGGVCVCMCRRGEGGCGGGGVVGEGVGETYRQRQRHKESCIQNLFCFSTVLQVTAAEVRPIC